MTDRPKGEGWWLASDGKWYPPDLQPGVNPPRTGEADRIPSGLTTALLILVVGTSLLLVVSAFVSFGFADAVQELGIDVTDTTREPTSEELLYFGVILLVAVAWIASGVVSLVWLFRVSKVADARGALERRWRGGWVIGAWFVPLGNLVLPRLMVGEIDRVFQVPYTGEPISGAWRRMDRTFLLDVWWALYLGAALGRVATFLVSAGTFADAADELAQTARFDAYSSIFGAAAGVAFALIVRRIYMASRTTESP